MTRKINPNLQIFSIFGQIDRVAAQIMIDEGKATKIPVAQIPTEALYNAEGAAAVFAIMFTDRVQVRRFEELIAELRA